MFHAKRNTDGIMKRPVATTLLLALMALTVQSQRPLTLAEAITLSLENNYDVKISGNNLQIARNNNTAGNAGYLPTLSANGNYTENISTSRQQYYDGRLREATNAASNSLNAGASLRWTLFDGFGMFIADKQLDQAEKIGETSLRDQMEATAASVVNTYFSAVQQAQRIRVLTEALNLGHELKTLAHRRMEIGMGSELDYLKAVADLNTDSATLLKQMASHKAALTLLNTLMGTRSTDQYLLSDSIVADRVLTYDELSDPLKLNTTLQLAALRKEVARYESRMTRTVQYPQLDFTAGYSYTKSTSAIGLIESNRNYGPSAGLSLSFTLFDGFKNRQRIRNADLSSQNADLEWQQTRQALEATLYTLFTNYETHRMMESLLRENLAVTRRNLAIALESYRLGHIPGIELRQYQLQQMEANDNLLLTRYELKVMETELLRLTGRIVQ